METFSRCLRASTKCVRNPTPLPLLLQHGGVGQGMEHEYSFYQFIFCVPVSLWLENSFYLNFRHISACEDNIDVERNGIRLLMLFIFS
jgi:hypothetical protein